MMGVLLPSRGQKMLAFEAVHWSTEIFVRFELTASQINPKSVCYMMHKFVSFLDIIHERSEVSQSMMGGKNKILAPLEIKVEKW